MTSLSPALLGRIALITGASRGIGQAVAIRFALEGAHVIITGRDVKGLEATDDAIRALVPPPLGGRLGGGPSAVKQNDPSEQVCPHPASPYGGGVTLVPLDLTEPPSIERFAVSVAERFGKLDILVGNAAVLGELSPLAHIAPEDFERVMATNLTANWHLIRCFDALLRRSEAGRAIFVTSSVAHRTSPYWGSYAISKAALESMVQLYAAENTKTPLKINLLDPGGVRTRMRASAFPGEDPMTLPAPDAVTDLFVKLASAEYGDSGQTVFVRS